METNTAAGEWCGPTRELESAQLVSLVHKSRKIVTENLRVDIEITLADEAAILVNKPPADAPVMGTKVDALPEATVLEIDEVICDVEPVVMLERATSKSGSMYPMHRDTLRPLRLLLALLVLVIAAGVAVTAMVV